MSLDDRRSDRCRNCEEFIDGRPYCPTMREGTILLAPDLDLWRQARDLFVQGLESL